MAENNSSAPLKTAEGAYPALPAGLYASAYHSESIVFTAEQMRAYAAQAVEAQAVPKSEQHGWQPIETAPKDQLVMVYTPPTLHDYPDSVNIRFDHIDSGIADDYWYEHGEHYEHYCCVAKPEGSIGPSADAPYTHWQAIPAAPSLEVKKAAPAPLATAPFPVPPKAITASLMLDDGGERPVYCLMAAYPSEADARAALAALAATPALPATEDSSVGDLAEASHQTKLLAQALGDCIFASGIVRRDLDMSGPQLLMFAEDLKELLLARQAEVQAEPTDAEIIDLNDGERYFSMSESRFGKDVNPHTQYHTGEPGYLQFARAVLARWGSAPQAQPADALTQAALDVLAERRRQVEVEGWTPERDDQYVHGDMSSAAGCYAMFTQAYPKGDPHHSWPWDKAWWKPSKDARRNRIKACALLLADIERLDRAAMAAAQEGGKAS